MSEMNVWALPALEAQIRLLRVTFAETHDVKISDRESCRRSTRWNVVWDASHIRLLFVVDGSRESNGRSLSTPGQNETDCLIYSQLDKGLET